ncbi:MAG: phosphatase PAP2 family protein [Candidatus Paceibacterota bacterium]
MIGYKSSIFLNSFLNQNIYFDYLVYFFAQIFPFLVFGFFVWYFLFKQQNLVGFLRVFLITIFSWGLSEILKFAFSFPRPFVLLPEVNALFSFGSQDSFPSGHATVFFALGTAIYFENKKLGCLFLIFGVFISISRVFSGVHYIHDILAGAILGVLVALFGYKYLHLLRNKS